MPSSTDDHLEADDSYPDQLLFRGRMQPWANHYAEVIDSAAQRYDIDEAVIAVPEIRDDMRCAKNPFTGEERVEMIEQSYEEDFDVGYDVSVVLHDSPLDDELLTELDDEILLYTRERKWHLANKAIEKASAGTSMDVTAAYEPRGSELEEDLVDEEAMASSATAIRQSLVAEDDRWRDWVPSSTADLLEKYSAGQEALVDEDEQGRRSAAWKHVGQLVSLDWTALPDQLRSLL